MKLIIICSWCGVKIGEKKCDVLEERLPRITHSICNECSAEVLNKLNQPNEENMKINHH